MLGFPGLDPFHPAVAMSDVLQRASRLTSHGDAHQNDRGKRKERKGNGSPEDGGNGTHSHIVRTLRVKRRFG